MNFIKINLVAPSEVVALAKRLSSKLRVEFAKDGTVIRTQKTCANLEIIYDDGEYIIKYSIFPELFRGLAICAGQLRSGQQKSVIETRQFETCGVMFDVSRNAVMTVDTAKDFIEYLAVMGLNMMMLYTEDTYEIEKYPHFGYMRSPYTKEEIKEIDEYALDFGIELIPCIQTLSHLATALCWNYASDIADTPATLYVGKQETYEFIEDMIQTASECFTSKRIHIGLDEASDVGLGKKLKNEGYTSCYELMIQHIGKVYEIARKHNMEPMMWSDMFFKFGSVGGDYDTTSVIPVDVSERLPSDIKLVYWEYTAENPDTVNMFLKRHQNEIKRETYFAGGIWTWNRVTVNFDKTFATAHCQLNECKKNAVKTVFATIWGNTCSLYNLYSTLPGIQLYAEHFYNSEVSDFQVDNMFEACTGYKLSDFMLLGIDDFSAEDKTKYMDKNCCCINSSAQHFFNDVLVGLYDKTLSGYDFKSHYTKYSNALEALADMGKMSDMFEQAKILTRIVLKKSYLGPKITAAYRSRDENSLKACINELDELLSLHEQYHKITMKIWYKTNKPLGWEGCDMILSNVEGRVKTAIFRLENYISGKFQKLEELEQERLYYNNCRSPLTESGRFRTIMTTCDY